MSDFKDDLKRCLSLSGSVSISLDARGKWQVNVRTKNLHAYSVEVQDDPFAAITTVAKRIEVGDLPSYDLFEAAAQRRDGRDGYLAAEQRAIAAPAPKPKPDLDLKARVVVENADLFEDLLG